MFPGVDLHGGGLLLLFLLLLLLLPAACCLVVIMAALRHRCGHYIFVLWFLSFYLFFVPA